MKWISLPYFKTHHIATGLILHDAWERGRHMDPWNSIESAEMLPRKSFQLIFDSGIKVIPWW